MSFKVSKRESRKNAIFVHMLASGPPPVAYARPLDLKRRGGRDIQGRKNFFKKKKNFGEVPDVFELPAGRNLKHLYKNGVLK